jgi:hypothetical protein
MYKSDEDKMMSDPKLKWSQSSVIKKEKNPAHDGLLILNRLLKQGLKVQHHTK